MWENIHGTYQSRFQIGKSQTDGVSVRANLSVAEFKNYLDTDYVTMRGKKLFAATSTSGNTSDFDHVLSARDANGLALIKNGGNTSTAADRRAILSVQATGGELQLYNSAGAVITDIAPGGMTLGSPTGGAKGVGTLNATAVYDDNTLLVCYPLEQYLDGEIDLELWDSRGKDGVHAKARSFVEDRAQFVDVDEFIAAWTTNRYLPSMCDPAMPDLKVGCVLNSLCETVDLLAIHDKQLRDRIAALDARVAALEGA